MIFLNGGVCDDLLEYILDLGSKIGTNGELVDGLCFWIILYSSCVIVIMIIE